MNNYAINLLKRILWMSMVIPILLSLSFLNINAKSIRIMPLGDSITLDVDTVNESIPDANRSGYRNHLWYLLDDASYSIDFVGSIDAGSAVTPSFDSDNEGYRGNTVADIRDGVSSVTNPNHPIHGGVYNLLKDQSDNGTPTDIVLLHIGTNHVNEVGLSTDTEVEGLLDEIDRYENDFNPIKVILALIINDTTNNTTITTFNDEVESMIQARTEDDITIVDMENGAGFIYTVGDDMVDQSHPNDSGYEKMANIWYSELQSIIPTHQWELDESSGPTYIDDYRGADGTCATCPTPATGQINGGQLFDATNDEISLADDNTYDWTKDDSFTISLWMKSNQNDHTKPSVLIGRDDENSVTLSQWWIGFDFAGHITFSLIDSDGTGAIGGSITDITSTVNDNQWHHVAITRDGNANVNSIYIDGVLGVSNVGVTYSGDFNINATITLGNLAPAKNSFHYKGSLDKVTLFNGALDENQINQLYIQDFSSFSIVTTAITTATVDIEYLYDVNSSDDDNSLFSLTNNPTGMLIDQLRGTITWTPTQMVNAAVTVVANNGSQNAIQDFVIKARIKNQLPTDMQHYWKLDEASSPYLDAHSGTDASCSTGCPNPVTGQISDAQDFNGIASDLTIPDDNSYDWASGDSFTLEFWMKPNTVTGTKVAIGRRSSDTNMAWWAGIEDAKFKFELRDTDFIKNSVPITSDMLTSGDTLTSGQWYHVAVVRDVPNDQVKIYLDGVESNNTEDKTTAGFSSTVPITIGYFIDSTTSSEFNFDGILDEIKLFDSALSAADINDSYIKGLNGLGEEDTLYEVSIAKTTDGAEPGTDANFTVTVTPTNNSGADITGDIVYTGTATEGSDYTPIANFSIADGESTALITLVTTDDSIVEDIETITATISNLSNGATATIDSASADLTSDDTIGITVSTISQDTTETGGTATFTLVLNSQPTADVTIALSSDNTAEGTVLPASVTFTTGDWNSTQTVTVTGIDDAVVDGTVNYNIITAAATSGDTNYNGVDADDISVNNTDNDVLIDTDNDGIPDITDTDDDNDGVLDTEDDFPLDATETTDTDNDGIGNNADTDDDNNGILDTEEQDWFTYNSNSQTATVGESSITVEGLDVDVDTTNPTSLTLSHKINGSSNCTAYIEIFEDGTIITGYRDCTDGDDSILQETEKLASGTQVIIKEENGSIVIITTIKLATDESFIIGGK